MAEGSADQDSTKTSFMVWGEIDRYLRDVKKPEDPKARVLTDLIILRKLSGPDKEDELKQVTKEVEEKKKDPLYASAFTDLENHAGELLTALEREHPNTPQGVSVSNTLADFQKLLEDHRFKENQ